MFVSPHPDRERRLALPDGRVLASAEFGPADGRPVLFVPGAASGRLMSFGPELLADAGVRLVSVDRPGLGASSPHPGHSLGSVADDLAALARELSDEPIPVVANSQGAPFALALATRWPLARLVLAAPADEVALPATRAQLPEDFRELIDRVAADPLGSEALFSGFTAGGFCDFVLGQVAPEDAAVYEDPDFRAGFLAVVQDALRAGGAGYARNTVLAMSPWRLPLADLELPVELWFGAADTGHSPDLGETLASRIPGASRRIVSGSGGALLWHRPELILGAALESAD
ncbi:alpha/beta fold hydrolase [Leucobacter sp. M11]|uniref:alpha/beta fold hydrolase n=1 Tax=Leucobacter sp. M11 TaxID=2993565 RepID=UPI002D803D4F|nr:alpha/beta hydrolase [Leucobacter sp. M11]MEB4616500.1 alpha/beta hydrolase [Leucobacter sp. M11]